MKRCVYVPIVSVHICIEERWSFISAPINSLFMIWRAPSNWKTNVLLLSSIEQPAIKKWRSIKKHWRYNSHSQLVIHFFMGSLLNISKIVFVFQDYSVVLMTEEAQVQSKDGSGESVNRNKPSRTSVPLKTRVCVNRGLLYLLDLGDPYNAAIDFECVIENEPNNIKVLHTMALCYHK